MSDKNNIGENNHLFCFGLGYSATKFAKNMLAKGWRVSGTCRTSEKFPKLKSMGITPYIFSDGLPLEDVWDLSSVTHILISIPPMEGGDCVINCHLEDIKNLPDVCWVGYLSTTGVYGNHDGGWVDENTAPNPDNKRSIRRLKAEGEWISTELPVHIFRLSGIYGKGRSAFDAIENGTAKRIKKENQFFSRIHVSDIVQILEASVNKSSPSAIYNCADDLPSSQEEVVAYAAKIMGINPPELIDFDKADLSPMARSFYGNSRKVRNNKIKQELGVKLKYPDYKAGLDAI